MELHNLSGTEKAAILIMSLPTDAASAFLSQLEDEEVERIMTAVSHMGEVSAGLQKRVVADFQKSLAEQGGSIAGGRERAVELAHRTLGADRGDRILANLGRDGSCIEWSLQAFSAEFIAQTLASEHAQTIALILSQLPAERGAEVIAALPESRRPEVVLRIADLVEVESKVIDALEESVAEMFGDRLGAAARVGGANVAALMLKRVSSAESDRILAQLETESAEIAKSIRGQMLTFNDLVDIPDRGFQILLREVASEDLVVALKTASDEMSRKVFSNVSSRAGKQLREELELLGPMKLSDVEAVQERIIATVRSLADEGVIELNLGDSDDVLV